MQQAVVEMLQTVGAGFLGRSHREPVMFEIQIVYLSIGIKEGVKYMSLEVRIIQHRKCSLPNIINFLYHNQNIEQRS